MPKECPEISWGDFTILRTGVEDALVLAVHLAQHGPLVRCPPRRMGLHVDGPDGARLVDVFSDCHSDADESGFHDLDLQPYAHRWYRVGSADNTLDRSPR